MTENSFWFTPMLGHAKVKEVWTQPPPPVWATGAQAVSHALLPAGNLDAEAESARKTGCKCPKRNLNHIYFNHKKVLKLNNKSRK